MPYNCRTRIEVVMARTKRDRTLEHISHRMSLPVQREPHWMTLEKGRALGYRRGASGGTWIARIHCQELQPPRLSKSLGLADDFASADGRLVLNYSQAQAKARKWFDECIARARGEEVQTGPLTVTAAWAAYRRDCERRGVKGLSRMDCNVNRHILPSLGPIELERLTQARIERWHEDLANAPARVRTRFGEKDAFREPPSTDDERRARRDTANRILTTLKAMLNYVKRRRMTNASGEAWREARPFKGTTASRVRYLSVQEAQSLVNACPPDFRRLVKGALFTGARFGEIARWRARDFNPSAQTIFIAESKSGRSRHVVLTDEGVAFFLSETEGKAPGSLIFHRSSVKRRGSTVHDEPLAWHRGDQSRFMAAACKAAELELLSFHELRHTYASALVNAGVPLAFIAEQLGHSGTRMVEKHYGHLAPSAKADTIRRLAPKLEIHPSDGTTAGTTAT